MSYFKHFPVVLNYEVQGQTWTGPDLTRRADVLSEIKNNANTYIDYQVQNGETPEMIADRFYDNVNLYWVILMFNDIYDIDSQWPLDQRSLDEYIYRKYSNPNQVMYHLSISTGAVVDADWPEYDRIPVTYYEHEVSLNEKLQYVKIPLPEYALQISNIHKKLIKE